MTLNDFASSASMYATRNGEPSAQSRTAPSSPRHQWLRHPLSPRRGKDWSAFSGSTSTARLVCSSASCFRQRDSVQSRHVGSSSVSSTAWLVSAVLSFFCPRGPASAVAAAADAFARASAASRARTASSSAVCACSSKRASAAARCLATDCALAAALMRSKAQTQPALPESSPAPPCCSSARRATACACGSCVVPP